MRSNHVMQRAGTRFDSATLQARHPKKIVSW
jgi:hypothetical protein